MRPGDLDPGAARDRPVSALPSVRARALAFAAIIVAGVAGGLIGYSFVGLQCHGRCGTPKGLGALLGAAVAAGGVAVVAVLTLRAMGEWRTIKYEQALAADEDDGPDPGRQATAPGPGEPAE
jgi:hypothetical protein